MSPILPLVLIEAAVFLVLVLGGWLAAIPAVVAWAILVVASAVLALPHVRNVVTPERWTGTDRIANRARLLPESPDSLLKPAVHASHQSLARKDTRITQLVRETEHLLDAFPDPLLVLSQESLVVHANAAARRLLGEIPPGQRVSRILRDPGLDEAIKRVLLDGRATGTEIVVTRDHIDRSLVVNLAPLAAGATGHSGLVAICHDVTEDRRAEQMRVDFVANASHEIRSPLATLIGCLETLKGPARDDPAARDMFLEMMDEQGKRMARLVDDLLSLSSIELREHSQPAGEVAILPLLQRLRSSMKFDTEKRLMTIRIDVPGTLRPVRGDAVEIEQALFNLMSNAVRYGREGSAMTLAAGEAEHPPDHLRVAKGPLVWISVADRGDGIKPHHLPRLTERFYRVDTARSRELGGTGLGLAIVKHILNRHRGELHVESKPGEGSVFTIWLPVVL